MVTAEADTVPAVATIRIRVVTAVVAAVVTAVAAAVGTVVVSQATTKRSKLDRAANAVFPFSLTDFRRPVARRSSSHVQITRSSVPT